MEQYKPDALGREDKVAVGIVRECPPSIALLYLNDFSVPMSARRPQVLYPWTTAIHSSTGRSWFRYSYLLPCTRRLIRV